jgi:hypothetical protein
MWCVPHTPTLACSNSQVSSRAKGPEHFDELMRNLTKAWTNNNCTPKTYRSCLPSSELASAGDWLSRAIYSEHLTEWLDQFGCSQVHLSDVTEDPLTAVNSLYEFMGVPNEEAAWAAVSEVYSLLNATQVANAESNNNSQTRSRKNAMNKASYAPMHTYSTRREEVLFDR